MFFFRIDLFYYCFLYALIKKYMKKEEMKGKVEDAIEKKPEVAATAETATVAEPVAPTPEQLLREHLKLKDGEDVHAHALTNLQDLKDYKDKNEALHSKILKGLQDNPDFAEVFREVTNNVPAHIAMARHFDMAAITPKEGDDDYEDFQGAVADRQKSQAEKEKYLKEMDDNVKMSAKQVDEFAKENKMSDQETEDFLKNVDNLVSDMVKGKVTKEALTTFYKGMKRDDDVSDAKKAGELEGKNAKIEAIKEKEDAAKGDGLPNIEAQNKNQEPAPKAKLSPFEQAMIAQNKKRVR